MRVADLRMRKMIFFPNLPSFLLTVLNQKLSNIIKWNVPYIITQGFLPMRLRELTDLCVQVEPPEEELMLGPKDPTAEFDDNTAETRDFPYNVNTEWVE